MPTLLIAIVAHKPTVDLRFMDSVMQAIPSLIQFGWKPRLASVIGNSDLAGARNRLFALGYVGKFDKMILIDTDMSWEAGTIERLLMHPVDIVGGTYRKKQIVEEFTVRTIPGPCRFVDPDTDESAPYGILEVSAIATGLMCISRDCIETLVEAHADKWYNDDDAEGGKAWNVFEFSVTDHERTGEDFHFCDLWRATGGKVWADPFLLIHHHGEATYSGKFADHLKAVGRLETSELASVN